MRQSVSLEWTWITHVWAVCVCVCVHGCVLFESVREKVYQIALRKVRILMSRYEEK